VLQNRKITHRLWDNVAATVKLTTSQICLLLLCMRQYYEEKLFHYLIDFRSRKLAECSIHYVV
jgi:hypothetical protein